MAIESLRLIIKKTVVRTQVARRHRGVQRKQRSARGAASRGPDKLLERVPVLRPHFLAQDIFQPGLDRVERLSIRRAALCRYGQPGHGVHRRARHPE